MNFKIGLVAIFALLALIFLVQNIEVMTVHFLFWQLSMSRAIFLFFILLTGFIIGWFLHSFVSYSQKKKN
ncbi:MAG TPA: LapA family protein [Smithella sp.]|jgi:uncharacterized integral membrane protein|nr:LapA family protein [Smithella sp.]NMC97934.1 LapA family protein [Deltaproteobacteria bacterium]OQC54064.1 MAG: hypothetical protein BWX55_00709 [Deltaproteobacteria bacterium ADurb.Bin022]HNQ65017.1 LapA family protein [Smithella sp.]HOE32313.1 LapA family protein [Smithella sp.]